MESGGGDGRGLEWRRKGGWWLWLGGGGGGGGGGGLQLRHLGDLI